MYIAIFLLRTVGRRRAKEGFGRNVFPQDRGYVLSDRMGVDKSVDRSGALV